MAFIRTRIINRKPYRYLEERYREGGKVRSKSTYLGPGGGGIGGGPSFIPRPIPPEQRGWAYVEKLMEKYPSPENQPEAAPTRIGGRSTEASLEAAQPGDDAEVE